MIYVFLRRVSYEIYWLIVEVMALETLQAVGWWIEEYMALALIPGLYLLLLLRRQALLPSARPLALGLTVAFPFLYGFLTTLVAAPWLRGLVVAFYLGVGMLFCVFPRERQLFGYFCLGWFVISPLLDVGLARLGLESHVLYSRTAAGLIGQILKALCLYVATLLVPRRENAAAGIGTWVRWAPHLGVVGLVVAATALCLPLVAALDTEAAYAMASLEIALAAMGLLALIFAERAVDATAALGDMERRLSSAEGEKQDLANLLGDHRSLRQMKHELKNDLFALRYYSNSGEEAKLRALLQRMLDQLTAVEGTLTTGKPLLDALVSAKARVARQLNVDLRLSVVVPELLPIDERDLCSIVGNMLDNALEALRKVPEEQRFLYVFFRQHLGMWQIEVVNSCDGVYRRQRNRLSTTKAEREGHGIGLSVIEELAEAHEGYCVLQPEENRFSIAVYLPLEELTR